MRRRTRAFVLTAIVVALVAGAGGSPANADWPTYHRDGARSGVDDTAPALTPVRAAWTSPALDGAVYAEPVVVGTTVYVATENDSVYALDEADGHVLWRTNVGTPVRLSSLPCGNIDPLGITGTPVVDVGAREIFVVAEVSGPAHDLVGLDIDTGSVRLRRSVDPPGADPTVHQERGALALANGRVYVPFGGLDGDCGQYHGWVVAWNEDGSGSPLAYQVPTVSEGGIWATPGPSVAPDGTLYVATGNGSSSTTFDHGDSVIHLDADLHELDFFAPTTWASDNANDADLGSTSPQLTDDGHVFQVGKSGTAYLLSAAGLGHIGGQVATASVCAAFGGDAYVSPFVYVPCTDGIRAVRVSGSTIATVWHASTTSATGPPVVAGGAVWSVGTGNGVLYALDPSTGGVISQIATGSVEHFTTPTVANGLVLVAATNVVKAFTGPTGYSPPPPPTTQGYWTVASDGGVFSYGTAPFLGSTGDLRLNRPIVGMAATRSGGGYWMVATDGGIFAFGDASFAGSTGSIRLNAPVVGLAPTPSSGGYWLAAADGGVFDFGDAAYLGSMGGTRLTSPVVAMAATPTGKGYWLFAADGGVFAFGDAPFLGSMGASHLNRPIVAAAATTTGGGYWLVAGDGGVFTFGDAGYAGSTGAIRLNRPIVGAAPSATGSGYRLVADDGGVFAFGDADFAGSAGGRVLNAPMVAIATH